MAPSVPRSWLAHPDLPPPPAHSGRAEVWCVCRRLGRSRVVLQQAAGKEGTWLSCDLNTCAQARTQLLRVSPQPGPLLPARVAVVKRPGLLEREQGNSRPAHGPVRPLLSCPRGDLSLVSPGCCLGGQFPACRGLHSVLFLRHGLRSWPPEAMSPKPPSS